MVGVRCGDRSVLSQAFYEKKIQHLMHKLCKTWTRKNFGLDSQERYRNYTFQYFHPKSCRRANIVIDFC